MLILFRFITHAHAAESKEIHSDLFFPIEIEKILNMTKTSDASEQTKAIPNAKINIEKNIEVEVAKKNFQRKTLLFSSLYEKSNSPYRGAISKTLRCENQEAQPQKTIRNTPSEEIISFKFFTNDYFILGVCEKKDLKYLGMVVLVYCKKSKSFAEISIFDNPNSKAIDQANLIRCL